ncbi:ParA family protein [Nocardia sp. ET3-3]|uniref:ParA family protein n=1 Tax=Nocardia terrae TaxID=2675851 RepID=A0A7K1V2H4_9NOCA|nr:ParA family protein [Nocardia terrae]MVU80840.1 ParA family protein [Nocardia terrae]
MNNEVETNADAAERDDYSAEQPVDLRRQRLRVGSDDGGTSIVGETDHLGSCQAESDPMQQDRDPYGVGEENLAGSSEPSADEVAAVREARLAMLLKPAAGVHTDPARWGWRGRVNAFGLRIRPRRRGDEVVYRQAVERIRQPLPGTPVVVVANPKGGSGKTPATVLLSALFGRHRGGRVVAWDAHEACGSLAARAASCASQHTVWDVLGHARELCTANADASGLARFLQRQPTLDEILASDQTPGGSICIGRDECAAILAVLRRHREMVVVDTGTNDRAEAFRWAVANATQLVVPIIERRDVIVSALRLLDGIAEDGHEDLAARTVIALCGVGPKHAKIVATLVAAGITRIVAVPFDPVLAGGERIVLTRMGRASVRAWTEVAATVADTVAETLATRHLPMETRFVPDARWAAGADDATHQRLLAYALHEGQLSRGRNAGTTTARGPFDELDPGW